MTRPFYHTLKLAVLSPEKCVLISY